MQTIYKILHSAMIEQEYLRLCLIEIEKKLNWDSSSLWKESDYIKLAQLISESSLISISPHTLKRLFGKIKYNDQYNPQLATKDALSKFIGYLDWEDYILKTKSNTLEESLPEEKLVRKNKIKKRNFLILGLLVLLFMIIYSFGFKDYKKQMDSFEFSLQDSIGKVPFTVPIRYDLSKVTGEDSLFIDFNFNHPYRGKQLTTPKKERSAVNFTYQIPGYYYIKLKKGNDTLCKKKVLAMSEKWDSYFVSESNMGKFWLDNQIEQSSDSLGSLYFSPAKLASHGFDVTKVYYIHHRLFQEFKIDGDNFEFETRFKDSKALGGITCYDFIIRLICEKNTNFVNLMESGCSQFSALKFGEIEKDGSQENMSKFKMIPELWNVLTIKVVDKNVVVYVNKKLIYHGSYKQPNGNIVGIENVFKGTGMLDYISIKDLKTAKEYRDDFD